MTWAKVDDGFWRHRKTRGMGDAARALWLTAASWCGENYETAGAMPPAGLAVLTATLGWSDKKMIATAEELVVRGLWHPDDGDGYRFHDWLDYNLPAAEVDARRAERAESGRKGGLAKKANKLARATAGARGRALANSYPVPVPVPVVPKKNDSSEGGDTHRVLGEGEPEEAEEVPVAEQTSAASGQHQGPPLRLPPPPGLAGPRLELWLRRQEQVNSSNGGRRANG